VLDDISDAVSFCIAPAWIYYFLVADILDPRLQELPYTAVAVFYALAGILRLVYFTLDRHPIPGFFKGMPSPAAALLVVAPMIILNQAVNEAASSVPFWGLVCFGMMIAAAVVMNLYPVRYLHAGRFMSRHPWLGRAALLLLISVFTPYYGYCFLFFMLLYALSPLVTWRIDPQEAARENRTKPARVN
jgi:phosphatidylserine synthase